MTYFKLKQNKSLLSCVLANGAKYQETNRKKKIKKSYWVEQKSWDESLSEKIWQILWEISLNILLKSRISFLNKEESD